MYREAIDKGSLSDYFLNEIIDNKPPQQESVCPPDRGGLAHGESVLLNQKDS